MKKSTEEGGAKNAILLIGDGLGPTVISATRIQFYGVKGRLFLDKTRHRGLVSTHSHDSIVTDSAAAASSMATGYKIKNGALSLSPSSPRQDKKDKKYKRDKKSKKTSSSEFKTILEMAAEQGKSVGLITTVEFSHATPAAFYAHVQSRRDTDKVIQWLARSPVDIILGAGLHSLDSYRKDLSPKFRIVTRMNQLKCDLTKPLLGSFFGKRFPFIGDVENKKPRRGALKKMVRFAMDCLSKNPKGYFLMVESGQIDQALHRRQICNALHETKEFDEVVEFVVGRVNKEKTLVLATADHDTGGLAINGKLLRGKKSPFFTKTPCWKGKVATTHHKKFPQHEYQVLRNSTDSLHPEFMHMNDFDPNKKLFIKSTHTAHDVDLFAWGQGAEKVHGFHDNTYIFTLLKEALEL